MWTDFEQSHSKLLAEVLSKVKGSIHLTAEDIESIKAKLQFKLTSLIDDMGQHFAGYRESLEKNLAAIIKYEIRQIVDFKMGELGLVTDDKQEELLEPVNKMKILAQDYNEFKLQTTNNLQNEFKSQL